MFKNLFAICLLVEDFDKSLDFYQHKLGLKLQSRDGKFANFVGGETSLSIFQKDEATTMFPSKFMRSGGGAVLGFQVDDLKKSCEQLKSKGVEILEGPKTTPWGQTVTYFQDPDHHIWEISEPFEE